MALTSSIPTGSRPQISRRPSGFQLCRLPVLFPSPAQREPTCGAHRKIRINDKRAQQRESAGYCCRDRGMFQAKHDSSSVRSTHTQDDLTSDTLMKAYAAISCIRLKHVAPPSKNTVSECGVSSEESQLAVILTQTRSRKWPPGRFLSIRKKAARRLLERTPWPRQLPGTTTLKPCPFRERSLVKVDKMNLC